MTLGRSPAMMKLEYLEPITPSTEPRMKRAVIRLCRTALFIRGSVLVMTPR